ncbi:MAG: FAD:protein FMN transferase, partial [Planctomycetota bacterium]
DGEICIPVLDWRYYYLDNNVNPMFGVHTLVSMIDMKESHRVNNSANWSRRSFLTPRGLGMSSGGIFGAILDDDKPIQADNHGSFGYWCIARRAMGCEFNVFVPPRISNATVGGEAALDCIEQLEELMTVYSNSSEMSYVNQHAAQGPVHTDDRLYQLLKRSAELSEQTDGAFDVSAGALVRAWGFVGGPKRVPTDTECLAALARSGMHHVEFDDEQRTVKYRIEGLEINLGSIGKGYAIDQAIKRMRQDFAIDCALIQGGLSSMFGLGSPPGDPRGWLVAIRNPSNGKQHIATVRLRDRALGTSGTDNQYFHSDGKRYGHLLDPRTGKPADELAGVSVLAHDAATADALATALFVMGLDKAADFCQNHPKIAALLVLKPASAEQTSDLPRILSFNLPSEDVNLSPGN